MNLFRTGAAGKALREASRAARAALLATSMLAMTGSVALAEARSTSTINGLTVDVIGGGSQAISATDAGVLIAHDGHRIEAEKGRITVDGQSHEVEPYATLTVRRDGYAYSVKADDTVIYEVSRIEGLKAAAEKGDAGAMNDLGVAYGEGEGVPQDWAKAAEYYRQAAEKGMMVSQSNYAYRLWNGEGVAEDHEAAVAWARKAADQGYAKAKNFVAVAVLNGDGAPQDTDAALALFEEAALDGYVDAARNLGLIRRKGIAGAIVDEAAARKWYGMAADAGDAQAIAALEEMGPAPAETDAPAPAATGTQVAATAEVEDGPPPLPKKAEEELPPPLPKKEEKPQISYFYALDDTRAGPVEGNVLEGLITDGTVKRDTLVWSKGMADWQPAGEVEALGPVFAALPPALPKAGAKPAATPNPTPVAKPKPLGGGFDGDWTRYLAGNWVYSLQQEGASLNLQVTLGADGSFAGQSHIQLPSQPPQQDSAKGKFTVEPLSDGKALMRVVYDDGDSDDSVLRRVGPDEIFNETEGFPLRRQ